MGEEKRREFLFQYEWHGTHFGQQAPAGKLLSE